ncbi:MAG: hypothetical protein MI923_10065 [Phycisphaerales bacterium]|nr:hypothetical protein [Phycisphaerales bacterium]
MVHSKRLSRYPVARIIIAPAFTPGFGHDMICLGPFTGLRAASPEICSDDYAGKGP